MKIVCDSCATKYSIADDKVRQGLQDPLQEVQPHHRGARHRRRGAAAPAAAATRRERWLAPGRRRRAGRAAAPRPEIRARLGRGEINGETYIWKEGLADWLKLSTVPEFADAASPGAQPTDVAGGAGDLLHRQRSARRARRRRRFRSTRPMVASSAPAPAVARVAAAVGSSARSTPRRPARQSAPRAWDVAALITTMASARRWRRAVAAAISSRRTRRRSAAAEEGAAVGAGPAPNHDGGRVENLTGAAARELGAVLAGESAAAGDAVSGAQGVGADRPTATDRRRARASSTSAPWRPPRWARPRASGGGGSGGAQPTICPTFGSFSAGGARVVADPHAERAAQVDVRRHRRA